MLFRSIIARALLESHPYEIQTLYKIIDVQILHRDSTNKIHNNKGGITKIFVVIARLDLSSRGTHCKAVCPL